MKTNLEQYQAAQSILRKNPSMRWDGKFGYYSNGHAIMDIYWIFDEPKEMFKITLNINGIIV